MVLPIEQSPRPRSVSINIGHLATEIAFYIAFVAFAIYFVISTWSSEPPKSSLLEKAFSIVWAMFTIYLISQGVSAFIGDRKLLAAGEVALGRVFHVRGGKHPRMEFSFQDKVGKTITALASKTRHIREGSIIIVFYDPSNPEKRCVPMDNSLWKIRLPQ